MGGLSIDQRNFVQTLADLSYGTGKGEGTAGGKGNMGLLYDSEGKMHVIKCNTHFSQAESAQKAVLAGKNKELLGASNNLRAEMLKIAKSLGMDNDAIRRVMGENEGGKSLLTRKAVASFVSELKKTVDESNREIREYGGDESEIDHSLDNIWKADRAKKSAWNMSFASVKASTEKGHNATVFSAEVSAARNARDLLFDMVAKNGANRALSNLAKTFDNAVAAALNDGKAIPEETFKRAQNIKANFSAAGLDWLLDGDKDAFRAQLRSAVGERFKSVGDNVLLDAMTKNFARGFKLKFDQKIESMVTTGQPTFGKLLGDAVANLAPGTIFNNIQSETGSGVVKRALGNSLKAFGEDVQDAIAKNVWRFLSEDGAAQAKMEAMLEKGEPAFSDIIQDAFKGLQKPMSEDADPPVASIINALVSQMANVDEGERGGLATKIWNAGLSVKFAENFRAMVDSGRPTFEKLVTDFVGGDFDKYGLPSPDALWDDLESSLTKSGMSDDGKKSVRDTLKNVKALVAHKDAIMQGIRDAYDEACAKAGAGNEPKPDFETFFQHGIYPDIHLYNVFKKVDAMDKENGAQEKAVKALDINLAWHLGSTPTSQLIGMIESFARFPEMYGEAKMKGVLNDLLVVLADTGCAQARLSSLETFMAGIGDAVVVSPVKHEPGEAPQDAILKEVKNAVEELRAEKKFNAKNPIPFKAVMGKMKDYVNGRVFAGVMWNKHQVYLNLTEEVLKECGIELSYDEKWEMREVHNDKTHMGEWDD